MEFEIRIKSSSIFLDGTIIKLNVIVLCFTTAYPPRSCAHVHRARHKNTLRDDNSLPYARARVIPWSLLSLRVAGRELTFTHAHVCGEDNCCGVIRHNGDGDERRTHTRVVVPSQPLTFGGDVDVTTLTDTDGSLCWGCTIAP